MKVLVSFVVPCYNMKQTIGKCLNSMINQNFPKNRMEIILVDDASKDNSVSIARNVLGKSRIKYKILLNNRNMKIAFTSNRGIDAASGEFIAYIDSDAVLAKDWLKKTLLEMKDKKVGAVAGFIKTGNPEYLWARLAGYELEWRYAQLNSKYVDHVSTTNTLYRRRALESVKRNGKYFDEKFHYGLDTDMSNRLRLRGWKLLQLKDPYCLHYWKNTFRSYFKMCFNTAYGRMILMEKYKRVVIDKVTTLRMLLQVPMMGLLLLFSLFGILFFFKPIVSMINFAIAFILFLVLILIQIPRASWVWREKRDFMLAILFPLLLQIRNFAALWAIFKYFLGKTRE